MKDKRTKKKTSNKKDIKKINGNIIYKHINNKNGILLQNDKEYHIKIIKNMGGKSKDLVYLIKNNNTKYIMKIFIDKKSGEHEIKIHKKNCDIFGKYMFVPKIFSSGKIKDPPLKHKNKDEYPYMIMEYIGKSKELSEYIKNNCKNNNNKNINPYNISLQLFYYLSKIHLNKIKHCDIHTKNILIIKSKKNLKLDFSFLGGKKVNTGKYQIKIIDFGISTFNEDCLRNRKFIGAVLSDMNHCKILKRRDYNDVMNDVFSMIKRKTIKSYKPNKIINEDLYIFVKILRLLGKISNEKLTDSIIENIEFIVRKNINVYKKICKILLK